MVKFLIKRPIAVVMTFLAVLIIGIITSTSLPISLMPDIEVPIISIHIKSNGMSARQMENAVVKVLRNVLKEVQQLDDIRSKTQDGSAWIELKFEHGTPIDLATIEVNEKIDKSMNFLPNNIRRPEVIHASASDIPIFYLMICQKKDSLKNFSDNFLQLSNFTNQVIKKRLEQLPEVALIDVSGIEYPEIRIVPYKEFLQNGTFSISQLETALLANNIDLGNLLINDGQYQYNIRFNTALRNISDIKNVPVNINGKIVKLDKLADIKLQAQQLRGNIKFNFKNAISLAVIKQSDAQVDKLKKELDYLISNFKKEYPFLEFSISRDQSKLLEYSIHNLLQSLLYGGLLAILAIFIILQERKAPLLIGLSIPISLIITLLFFYIFDLSINIISLSGLVLGVGMMIDNSIIVIDNITQFRQRSLSLDDSCESGTNEIIRPLISSILTTCAVFIPLVFMKGIAGVLFYDQAIAIAIGLFVSLITSITLLPTLYRIFYFRRKTIIYPRDKLIYFKWYETGLKFVFRHQALVFLFFLLLISLIPFLLMTLPITQFPEVEQNETILHIEWNEPITLGENNKRVEKIFNEISTNPEYVVEEAGEQQYMLVNQLESGSSENNLYLKTSLPMELKILKNELSEILTRNYPYCEFNFTQGQNPFNTIFIKKEAPIIARFKYFNPESDDYLFAISSLQQKIESVFPENVKSKLVTRKLILLETDPEMLLLYNIGNDLLYREIKYAFNVFSIFVINDYSVYMPVSIGSNYSTVNKIIQNTNIENSSGEKIPLSGLVKISEGNDLKTIIAGKDGEFFPIMLDIESRDFEKSVNILKNLAKEEKRFVISIDGSIMSNKNLMNELLIIALISLLLLFFILAAHFESFIIPIIILIEIPIDLFGALLFLKLFGEGINIMSSIGIIVMTGVIINDSILKIDTINKMISQGNSLVRSLFEAGRRRLKPIIITSMTTILAMVPFLFQKGMGSELQKPLAISIIGGMLIGTMVSLFLIPLLFFLIKKES